MHRHCSGFLPTVPSMAPIPFTGRETLCEVMSAVVEGQPSGMMQIANMHKHIMDKKGEHETPKRENMKP